MDARERELWQQADRILDALLDLPEVERESRLSGLAADPNLRGRVRRLLAAHGGSGPLDAPSSPPDTAVAAGLSGQRLGRWRLLEEIGRGGMAVVYRAVAEHGAEGQVAAVKVLTLGSLAQLGRERFLQEQQALLRLRHAYIAALYDAGIAADGTPWLAMALVDGEPIDRWCRDKGLDAAARVELVLQVCEALDYSHRNLVVHRDIKPSNVLVDADGHVRVLDFGIARILDEDDVRTRTQLRALTPEYAAPEQFAGAPPSTAMDVYGVGALLYRLLAGAPPRRDAQGAIAAPSRALRTRPGRHRPPDLRQRIGRLRGDLDTVTMKALAERPEDRYAGVGALADDLRRWLAQRPIRARPPSLRYRFGRFVARNRWQTAAATGLFLALAIGVGGIVWQAEQARRQAERAELTQAFLHDVFAEADPLRRGGRNSRIEDVLRDAAAQASQRFAARPDLQVETLRLVGELQALNGDNTGAVQSLRRAQALDAGSPGWDDPRRRSAMTLASALFAVGRPEEARRLLETWLDTDRPAGGASEPHCKGHALLAQVTPQVKRARERLEAVLADCRALPAGSPARIAVIAGLSTRRRMDGAHPEAFALVGEETEALRALPALSQNAKVERLRLIAELAIGLSFQRRHDEAVRALDEALRDAEAWLGADSPLLAPLLQTWGGVLNNSGRSREARQAQERALALIESHGEIQNRALLGSLLIDLGVAAHAEGRAADAERYWERALPAYLEAGMEASNNVGTVLSNLAVSRLDRGDHAGSAEMAAAAAAHYRQHVPERLDQIAIAEFNQCIARAYRGEPAAIGHCLTGVELDLRFTPGNDILIGEGQQYLADAHCALGQWEEALHAADGAIALLEPAATAGEPGAARPLAMARHHRAEALAGLGRRAEARRYLAAVPPPDDEAPAMARARRAVGP